MKKSLLFLLAMLAIAGATVAQDVYYSGYHVGGSGSGQNYADLYKNGTRVANVAWGSYDCNSTGVFVDEATGQCYWIANTPSDFYILRDDESSSVMHKTDAQANALAAGYGDDELYYILGHKTEGGVNKAARWRPDGDEHVFGGDTYNSELCGARLVNGGSSRRIYYCGYRYTSSSVYEGVVWNGTIDEVLTISDVRLLDIDYYNGDFYTVGRNNSNHGVVYKNSTLLYDLGEYSNGFKIVVEGGDIYTVGYQGTPCMVWKNGEVLYQHNLGFNGFLKGIAVNSEGVYYVGNNDDSDVIQGVVFKDGEELYAPTTGNGCAFNDVYVTKPECDDAEVRSMPYFEGFETGYTDWECWTKIDVDNNNGTPGDGFDASYWDRGGLCSAFDFPDPYWGDHFAIHRDNEGAYPQEGWLVSPKISLSSNNPTLSFYSYNNYSSYYGYEGVWISTGNDPTNTSTFTEIWSPASVAGSWEEINLDLSAYGGQNVYIAFKYSGTNAHEWLIDNVSVYEDWAPCPPVTEFPFVETFDTEIGTCWYVMDFDMSGGQYNWKYDASQQCAYHPWGPSSYPQMGALVSPAMTLGSGLNYTLTFSSYINAPSDYDESSLWIALDQTGVPTASADWTKIWEETNPVSEWTLKTIDLSAYAGHTVNLAFQYAGTWAHGWYIDDFTVTAALPQYNINVEANNAAWGTVTGGGTYEQGETVTITATANSGYEFKKWTKDGSDVSTSESYTFTATENATYVAVFGEPAVNYYTVNTAANPAAGGTVTGGGTYAGGTEVTLTATPNEGYEFVKWNDNNTDNPRTITVTGDVTYTAQFSLKTYNLSVSANPVTGGNVTGGGNYSYGEYVTITATPNEGYQFLNWNDGVTEASRTVRVISDATYVAHFADVTTTTYTVTVVSGDPTMGTVSGGGTYPEGSEITISASPFGTNVFKKWDDGNTDNPRTVTVTADVTYTAIFEAPTLYTITVVSLNPEMGSVSGGGNFPMGAEVTIQANPLGGYYFDGWNDNNYDNPRTITVTGNATYSARFSAQQAETYVLTVTCNPMHGYVEGSGNYLSGTNVTVTAVPYDGYEFDHWNDNVTQNPRTVTVSNNMTLVAFFKATGVGENGEPVMSLYPNPAKESIRLKGIEANSEVVIYNTLGMMVKTVNANAEQEINVSDLAAGIYSVRCGKQVLRFVKM